MQITVNLCVNVKQRIVYLPLIAMCDSFNGLCRIEYASAPMMFKKILCEYCQETNIIALCVFGTCV